MQGVPYKMITSIWISCGFSTKKLVLRVEEPHMI